MRYIFTLLLSTLMAVSALAQESSKQEIVKTG